VAVAAKQRVETPDEASKRFVIAGDYEPVHCVIDAFAAMLEEGVLKF